MTKTIKTNGRHSFIVDVCDFDLVSKYKWFVFVSNGKPLSVHIGRSASVRNGFLNIGELLIGKRKGHCIDHINLNPLDNRRSNLRHATKSQNAMNVKKSKRQRSTSKFKGIYWNKDRKRWVCRVHKNGKSHFVGYFNDELDAASAYNEKAKVIFKEFALLNDL